MPIFKTPENSPNYSKNKDTSRANHSNKYQSNSYKSYSNSYYPNNEYESETYYISYPKYSGNYISLNHMPNLTNSEFSSNEETSPIQVEDTNHSNVNLPNPEIEIEQLNHSDSSLEFSGFNIENDSRNNSNISEMDNSFHISIPNVNNSPLNLSPQHSII